MYQILESILPILLLTIVSLYYAWRYSRLAIDPDQAMFLFEAMGCGVYGRDYADCKSPAIHIWFWLLSKIGGRSVERIRFIHYFIVGISSGVVYFLTGNFWVSLGYLVLLQSGWLLAFHGNVGQLPAVFLTIGLASENPYILMVCTVLAIAFEPKLVVILPVFMFMYPSSVWILGVISVIGAVVLAFVLGTKYEWWEWFWEANWTIPRRMTRMRFAAIKKGIIKPFPWYTARVVLYLAPWVIAAVLANPNFIFWLPPVLFLLFSMSGFVLRQNHFIPIIPWLVVALDGANPVLVYSLIAVDWFSAGFYLGDIWDRFYDGIREANLDAKVIGERLRGKAGSLFVTSMHSGVYVYAQKKVPYGLPQQIEIREVAHERRARMVELWKKNPADWVVDGWNPLVEFRPVGYREVFKTKNDMRVYKKGA